MAYSLAIDKIRLKYLEFKIHSVDMYIINCIQLSFFAYCCLLKFLKNSNYCTKNNEITIDYKRG